MARPQDLQGDARVLYGPLAQRPTAAEAGSGALWVDPADQALYQVQSGNWVRSALPPTDDDSSIPAGVPVLRGPYIVDFSDIPHDGDTLTLWTPQVGDVLLALLGDSNATVFLQAGGADPVNGGLDLGTTLSPTLFANLNYGFGIQLIPSGYASMHVCATAAPIQVRYTALGDPDLTAGHSELYALVARAVAP